MSPPSLTDRQQIAAVAIVAGVVGVAAAPTVLSATTGTSSTVAVVEIDGLIGSSLADDVEQEMQSVRNNESVEAVVLKMNSPGGQPAASERMYMAIQRTAEEKPVVASVQGISASGGYYAMLPAETIYVLPTSRTGSVGLAAGAPQPAPPVRGPSGPNKRGSNVIGQWGTQETLADTFIDTVMQQRRAELNVSRSEVAKAKVYLGTRAVRNGFADRIGSVEEAVREAADRANVEEYAVDRRTTGSEGGFPLLARTDGGVVAVHAPSPTYGEIRPVSPAFVYEGALPHVDTLERITPATAGAAETTAGRANTSTRDAAGARPAGDGA